MLPRKVCAPLLCAAALPIALAFNSATLAQDTEAAKKEVKAAGIMFDFDLKAHWITFKADGENEVIKYHYDATDKKVTDALAKTVFPSCRAQLTYKDEGDSRRLVSIKRQVLKAAGTVTGEVVKVHSDFWVEVKPKVGVADAFAPGANYNDKAFMEKLRGLKPGDVVMIKFHTDFERHRIDSLTVQKKADSGAPSLSTGQSTPIKN